MGATQHFEEAQATEQQQRSTYFAIRQLVSGCSSKVKEEAIVSLGAAVFADLHCAVKVRRTPAFEP